MKRRAGASKWILLATLVSTLLLSSAIIAGAQTQTTVHFKAIINEVTSNFYPVGDPADGHFFGVSLKRGLTIFETGEIVPTSSIEYIDISKGVGTTSG